MRETLLHLDPMLLTALILIVGLAMRTWRRPC